MGIFKRTLLTVAIAIAVTLCCGSLPALAAEEGTAQGSFQDDAQVAAQSSDQDAMQVGAQGSGTCGTCSWQITSTGELIIAPTSGTSGTLDSVTYTSDLSGVAPWYSQLASIYTVTIKPGVKTGSGAALFARLINLKSITGLSNLDTSAATDMSYMFHECYCLTSVDLSGFDTSHVTTMDSMFSYDAALTSLDVSSFDTSKVTDFDQMFYSVNGITSLDLSSFDTTHATTMQMMVNSTFACEKVTVGSKFSFTGAGTTMLAYLRPYSGCTAPIAWVSSATGESYSASQIVEQRNRIADTYTATYQDIGSGTCGTCSWRITPQAELIIWPTNNTSGILADISATGVVRPNGTVDFASTAPWFGKVVYKVTIKKGVATASDASLFAGMHDITSMDIANLDTSRATNMDCMFGNCENLASVDLSSLDTSGVNSMYGMFAGSWKLTVIDISGFKTGSVKDMSYLFANCTWLATVKCAGLDTSNVTKMGSMFRSCTNLRTLDMGSFNTSNVTDMSHMFDSCLNIESLDMRSFNTSNVTNMYSMFGSCTHLTSLNIASFNTAKVTDMSQMFSACSKLSTLDLSSFDTSKVTAMEGFLSNVNALRTFKVGSGFSFKGAGKTVLTALPTPDFSGATGKWLSAADAVAYTSASIASDRANIADTYTADVLAKPEGTCGTCTWQVTDDGELIIAPSDGVSGKLADISIKPGSSVLDVIGTSPWYYVSTTIKKVTVKPGVIAGAEAALFYNCTNVTSMDLSGLDTSMVTSLYGMFWGCESLVDLDLSGFDTSKATDTCNMFKCCRSLVNLDLSSFDTSKITEMYGTFWDCESLESLDISSFDTSRLNSGDHMRYLFTSCYALKTITLGDKFVFKMTGLLPNASSKSPYTGLWVKEGSSDTFTSAALESKYASGGSPERATYSWQASTPKVTFSANGATSGTVPATITASKAIVDVKVPTNTGLLACTGYSFVGWNTAQDGSGTAYSADGTAVLSLNGYDVRLYAQWKAAAPATLVLATDVHASYTGAPVAFNGAHTLKASDGTSIAGGTVTYVYAASADAASASAYSTTAPTDPGIYAVKGIFIGDATHGACVSEPVTFIVAATVPGAPANLVAVSGFKQVTLTWAASFSGGSTVTSYNIFRDESVNPIATVSGTSYTDTGLVTGVPHTYSVAAINGVGQGVRSELVSASASKLATTVTLASSSTSFVYDGKPQAFDGTATVKAVNGDTIPVALVSYIYSSDVNGTYTANAPTSAGTWWVKGVYAGGVDYTSSTSAAISYAIGLATPTVTIKGTTMTYNGRFVSLDTPIVTGVGDGDKPGSRAIPFYYVDEACTYLVNSESAGSILDGYPPKNAGTYYAKAMLYANGNYTSTWSNVVKVVIEKAASSITLPASALKSATATQIVVGGATATVGDGTILYALSTTDVAPGSDADWRESGSFEGLVPNATYYAFACISEGTNYKEAVSAGVAVQTRGNDISQAETSISGNVRNVIPGAVAAPTAVVVVDGVRLVAGTDYRLLYNGSATVPTSAGTYEVEAQGVGRYSGIVPLGNLMLFDVSSVISQGVVYRVHSAAGSGKVLDVAGTIPVTGANVSVWSSNGGKNQCFTFESNGDGYYRLRNVANPALVLDAAGSYPQAGSNVSTWTYNGGVNQLWVIVPNGDGTYTIASAYDPLLILQILPPMEVGGSNVALWYSMGNAGESWTFEDVSSLAGASVALSLNVRDYPAGSTFADVKPDISATFGATGTLAEGTDFEVSFKGPDGTVYSASDAVPAAGEYTVVLSGTGSYHGEKVAGTLKLYDASGNVSAGDSYRVRSAASTASEPYILDVAGNVPKLGANVSIWTDNGGANQCFTFELGADGFYTIKNFARPDFVLDAAGYPPVSGANVSTWTINGGTNQRWVLIPVGGSGTSTEYTIATAYDASLVLDAAGAQPSIGANVSAYVYNGGANQRWLLTAGGVDLAGATVTASGMVRDATGAALAPSVSVWQNGRTLSEGVEYTVSYTGTGTTSYGPTSQAPAAAGTYIVSVVGTGSAASGFYGSKSAGILAIHDVSGAIAPGNVYRIHSASDSAFVLDVAGVSPVLGSNVSIWTNNNGANQCFTFEPDGNGYYVLRNVANTSLVLDAAGAQPVIGANVSTWTSNGGMNQRWVLLLAGDGSYTVASAYDPSFVLDAAGAVPAIGANVSVWTSNGGANQRWILETVDPATLGVAAASADVSAPGTPATDPDPAVDTGSGSGSDSGSVTGSDSGSGSATDSGSGSGSDSGSAVAPTPGGDSGSVVDPGSGSDSGSMAGSDSGSIAAPIAGGDGSGSAASGGALVLTDTQSPVSEG